MRNSFTIWTIGLMLAAFGAAGMQSCSKEDMPEPPKQEDPTTPDDPDTPDDPVKPDVPETVDIPETPANPDPAKIYKPVNKLSQIFKTGYLKKSTFYERRVNKSNSMPVDTIIYDPVETEYFTDANNNLVKVTENGLDLALFEYGYFVDKKGDEYQVKYTRYDRTRAAGDVTITSWCKLDENERVVDQYSPEWGFGYYYEYSDGRVSKIRMYKIVDGKQVENDVVQTYEWQSDNLAVYRYYPKWGYIPVDKNFPESVSEVYTYSAFTYPEADSLIENRGGLFSFFNTQYFAGIDNNLFMAALLGKPSQNFPLKYEAGSYMSKDYEVGDIKLGTDGLPESVDVSMPSGYSYCCYYNMKYIWRR